MAVDIDELIPADGSCALTSALRYTPQSRNQPAGSSCAALAGHIPSKEYWRGQPAPHPKPTTGSHCYFHDFMPFHTHGSLGLHHYLETMAPAAGIQIQHLRLRELVYADDICLMASPEHLQALVDAMSSYCAILHMEISVLKTKVMVVSPVPAPAVAFLCNANPIEPGYLFQVLGPSFSSIRCCCAFGHPNQVKGWWFLGCCPATAFFVAVWQNHQLAFTFIAGCLGVCLAVWLSSVGHAQPACCCC